MNPLDEIHRGRLFRSSAASYRDLEPFRALSHALVLEHAGSGYGHGSGERFETVLNLVNQTVDAYMMSLVANRPRVLLTTKQQQLKPFAKKFQIGLNNLIQEIRLEEALARWVLDAFFGLGVVKIHLANSAPVMLENGEWVDPGIPFVSNVALDNFVFDKSATVWHEIRYSADWYRIPFEDLKSNLYDQDAVADLQPTSKFAGDEERLEKISRGQETDLDEFCPMIDVADFWVPEDRKIYTWAFDPVRPFEGKGDPIAVLDWDGPEGGCHDLLGFGEVPENIMPTSPASHLNSLAKLANNLIRKQGRQAKRQRDVTVYSASAAPSAKRMKKAGDGEWIEANDAKEIVTHKLGGVDNGNQAFLLGIMEMFDRMAGNLPAMLGLGPQADTVGQEKLIHGAVSSKEAKMQMKVLSATTRVLRNVGWMLWTDSVKVMPATMPIPGAPGYEVDATWTPEDREGNLLDYNLSIDVYSMPYQSPAQRVQALSTLMREMFIPLEAMITAQGGVIDVQKMADMFSEYGNLPELSEIIKWINVPTDGQEGPAGDLPQKASTTTRNYNQRRVPTGGTMESRRHIQQQAWLGGSVNDAQAESMTRPAAA